MRLFIPMVLGGIALIATGALAGKHEYDFRSSREYQSLRPKQRQALEKVHRNFVLLWEALDVYAEAHEGKAPASLDSLVPRCLMRLPDDPFATLATAQEKNLGDYSSSRAGWGYRYRQGQGNSFVIASVGLPDFPYLAERGNVGLYRPKGLWLGTGATQIDDR